MELKGLNVLYLGTTPPHQGGSAIVADYLLPGLAAIGCRVRALAPITDQALADGDHFARRHPEISITRYRVPFFSNAVSAGSTDAEYRSAEDAELSRILPTMIRDETPDLILLGRESFAWHVGAEDSVPSSACVLIVHGDRTLAQLIRGEGTEPLLHRIGSLGLIITVAKHLGSALESLGLKNVRVIPNPVDVGRFSPRAPSRDLIRRLAIPEGGVVVLHASKLASVKRPFDLIESARIAIKKDPRLIYIVAGDGACRPAMEQASREAGVSASFRFIGWIDSDSMPDYMNLADIVAMPSEREGQSLACLEAQACARLLIASDIQGQREIVTDRETGLLFTTGDIDDLAAKTLWAAANPQARLAIGRKARVAAESHSHDRIIAAYAESLADVAERGRANSKGR